VIKFNEKSPFKPHEPPWQLIGEGSFSDIYYNQKEPEKIYGITTCPVKFAALLAGHSDLPDLNFEGVDDYCNVVYSMRKLVVWPHPFASPNMDIVRTVGDLPKEEAGLARRLCREGVEFLEKALVGDGRDGHFASKLFSLSHKYPSEITKSILSLVECCYEIYGEETSNKYLRYDGSERNWGYDEKEHKIVPFDVFFISSRSEIAQVEKKLLSMGGVTL